DVRAGEQSGLLRRSARRPARRGLVGREPGALVRGDRAHRGGDDGAGGRSPDPRPGPAFRRRPSARPPPPPPPPARPAPGPRAPAGAVYSRATRLATLCWTLPLWIALVLGLLDRALWRWPRAAAPATVLALTVVHAMYWTDLRMRAPIVPAIALIVSGARRPA